LTCRVTDLCAQALVREGSKLKHFHTIKTPLRGLRWSPFEYESHERRTNSLPVPPRATRVGAHRAPSRFRAFLLGSGRRTPRAPQSWLPTASLRYHPLRNTYIERLPRRAAWRRTGARADVRARVWVPPDFIRASARARAIAGRSDPAHASVRHQLLGAAGAREGVEAKGCPGGAMVGGARCVRTERAYSTTWRGCACVRLSGRYNPPAPAALGGPAEFVQGHPSQPLSHSSQSAADG